MTGPAPVALAEILTPDEIATLPFRSTTNLTASMATDVAAHFAQCSPENQRGFVLGAARVALAGRTDLADALNALVTVAIEYGEPGASFADDKPARRFVPEVTYGTPVTPTVFLPMTAEPDPPPGLSRTAFDALREAMNREGLAP